MNLKELEEKLAKCPVCPKRKRRIFTKEFQEVICSAIDNFGSAKVAKLAKVSTGQISKWQKNRQSVLKKNVLSPNFYQLPVNVGSLGFGTPKIKIISPQGFALELEGLSHSELPFLVQSFLRGGK